ncbi:MAG TPA: hypothetical protein VL282_06510, partial [Tepidisphaeraceae bacterium]|nr:hypothetical protein [Tepidisphaeraceae bacterium]
MSAENGRKPRKIALFHGILLVALQFAFVLHAAQPRLTQPVRSVGQFQFTLQGETNVGYLIETSTNLSAWTRVLTNTESPAVRTITVSGADAQSFWRARAPLFQNAITATGIVTNAGNGWIDSFDSADPNFSTSGQYDPAKQKAGGNIVTASGAVGAVSVGNMRVAGAVRTGPGGTVTLNTNGGVGSLAWLNNPPNAGMVEPGYVNDEVILSIPDATVPDPFGPFKAPGVNVPVDGTNYHYVLYSGDYGITGDLLFTGPQRMLVIGKARLFVTGTLSTSGQAFILIGTNGTVSDASLEIYAGGNVALSG